MARILTDAPKRKVFVKQPSLLEQHGKPVFIHPAQRSVRVAQPSRASLVTSWPSNSKTN